MARLGDVVSILASSKQIDGEKVWLLNLDMVEQQTGKVIAYNFVSLNELNGSIIQFDTENVLYLKLRPNLNKVVLPVMGGFATSEMLPLRPDTHVLCKEYLALFLRSDAFVTWASSKTAGAKMPRLSTRELLNKEMPLPVLERQYQIASVFDKISGLIALRKQQLAELDELVKARFVEMFDSQFPMVKAEDVCIDIVDCPHATPKYTGDNLIYPAIRTSEIKRGQIIWESMKYVDKNEYQERTKRLVPKAGDIVYAREGTYGDCVILPPGHEFCLGQRTMLFRPDTQVCTSEYLHQALRSSAVKRQADESNAGSTVPHVNIADAKAFIFPLPQISLQLIFSKFIVQVEKTRLTVRQGLDKLELIKRALMQQYFG